MTTPQRESMMRQTHMDEAPAIVTDDQAAVLSFQPAQAAWSTSVPVVPAPHSPPAYIVPYYAVVPYVV